MLFDDNDDKTYLVVDIAFYTVVYFYFYSGSYTWSDITSKLILVDGSFLFYNFHDP